MENNVIAWKRVGIFIAFPFGVAWLVALGLYLTGRLTPTPVTLVALAVGYSEGQVVAWQNLLAAALDVLQPAIVEEVIYRFD